MSAHDLELEPETEKLPGQLAFPMSFAQQRLWFIDRMEVSGASYNVPAAWRLAGTVDETLLEAALNDLIDRHEALRTVFQVRDGVPVQVVKDRRELPGVFGVEDLRMTAATDRDAALRTILREAAGMPFSLNAGPLLRLVLVHTGPDEDIVVLVMHHIVCDAGSTPILLRELSEFYAARRQARPARLPALPVQYADYAVWQREWLQGERLEQGLAFWKEQLRGPLPVLELPLDRERPEIQSFHGARYATTVPGEVGRALLEVGRREGTTPFITLLSALQVFLHRETSQDDVLVGSPISGRNQQELEGLIGFFLNTLVFRADLSGNPSYRQCLRRLHESSLRAYAHQDLPFERIVEEIGVERDASRHPVFQAMFVLHPPGSGVMSLAGLPAEPLAVPGASTAKFDLLISVAERDDGLRLTFEYNTDLFDRARVQLWADHFTRLLAGIAADPDAGVDELPLLSGAETNRIVEEWNGVTAPAPSARSVIELFERQVRERPDAVAVEHGRRRMTYAELDTAADLLARRLRALDVGPDCVVALALERSEAMLAAVLGVLKAGGAYAPIDPEYPADRISMMLEDSATSVVLTQSHLVDRLPPTSATVLAIDALPIRGTGLDATTSTRRPEDLAYVIFTSGSTGRPKGVAMPHGPLLNLLEWQIPRSVVGAGGRTLQFASLSFDVSFQEIFSTLGAGGTLVLIKEEERRDPSALLDVMERHGVQRIFLPYIALQHLADAAVRENRPAAQLQEVITAGEQLQVTPNIRRWLATMPVPRLENQYGPSETHVITALALEGDPASWPALPAIGKPIPNARTYILNGARHPVPVGAPGELWLAGETLARGYLQRPELTAERFLPDPFAGDHGARMYRSGDLARHRADGTIEYLGRSDLQVKIRGHRVEPAEIEALISGHRDVAACAVTAPMDPSGSRQLVAFVVPREPTRRLPERLKIHLKDQLPAYMVPSRIILRESLPLTPSGKVDRRALAVPVEPPDSGTKLRPRPETTLEAVVIRIWEELLPGRRIEPTDDFFAIGGHSLLAARMVDEIARTTGLKLPLTMLFRGATVRDVARHLLSDHKSQPVPEIIELQAGKPGVPGFFMAHGDFTAGGFYCRALARSVSPDQPVYAIPPFVPDGSARGLTIEAMASYHVAAIRVVQPKGPYRLGGYCVGGLVAFEIARQLRAAGEPVDYVLVVDASALNARYRWARPWIAALCALTERDVIRRADRFTYLMSRVRRLRHLPLPRLIGYLAGFPVRLLARRTRRLLRRPQPAKPSNAQVAAVSPAAFQLAHHFTRAQMTYFPGEFDGRVDLLWATEGGRIPTPADVGWWKVSPQVELMAVPATHVEVVTTHLPGVLVEALSRLNGPGGSGR